MKSFHYIHLLTIASKNQARALLETASKEQVQDICLIIFNLSKNITVLQPKTKQLLLKHKKLVQTLCKKNLLEKTKYRAIRKHWLAIYNLLISAKTVLLKALEK